MTLKCAALVFKIKLLQLETAQVVIAVVLQMTLGLGTLTGVVYLLSQLYLASYICTLYAKISLNV